MLFESFRIFKHISDEREISRILYLLVSEKKSKKLSQKVSVSWLGELGYSTPYRFFHLIDFWEILLQGHKK